MAAARQPVTFGQPRNNNNNKNNRGGGAHRGQATGHLSRVGMGADMMPSYEVDDRVLCKYCGRKFNEIAAERHIPHC